MSSRDFHLNQNHSLFINFLYTTLATYPSIEYANDGVSDQIVNFDDNIINNNTTNINTTDALVNNTILLSRMPNTNNISNYTLIDDEPIKKDFVFDRTDVRVIFITMYTLVFCCCFFGK